MPKERFEIGEMEKHIFTCERGAISKRIKIEQDCVIVTNELYITPRAKKFLFDVGSSEPHHVEITWEPLHPMQFELRVDGQKVHPLL